MARNIGIELPQFSDLREMLDQHLNRQSALDLELVKIPGFGFFQNTVRQGRSQESRSAHPASAERSPSGTSRSNTAPARWKKPHTRFRKTRRLARACNIIGRMVSRRFSNGSLSRKEERLVGGPWPRPHPRSVLRIRPSFSGQSRQCRADQPFAPAGSICFQPDIACPEKDPARTAPSETYAKTRSRCGVTNDLPKTIEPVWTRSDPSGRMAAQMPAFAAAARHSPHHARSFILARSRFRRRRRSPCRRACRPNPCRSATHRENAALPDIDCGGEHGVDGRLAEIDRRAVVERDHRVGAMAREAHMTAAGAR